VHLTGVVADICVDLNYGFQQFGLDLGITVGFFKDFRGTAGEIEGGVVNQQDLDFHPDSGFGEA